ncbi:MAG: aminotransferase class IV [Planctomycetota bacterium]|nr:aminotransferase class IV [Planctomycetota bacterium]
MSRDEARVSASDAGLLHGVGLFETLLARSDEGEGVVVFDLDAHVARLLNSAAALGLSTTLRGAECRQAIVECALRELQDTDATFVRVRLTVTGGDLNLVQRGSAPPEHVPTILAMAQPAATYPEEMLRAGALAVIADWKANPLDRFAGHKTLNYWARLQELQRAAAKRAAEALVFQVTNHLAGGCVSNAFLVVDGVLLTPIARGEEGEVGAGASGSVGAGSDSGSNADGDVSVKEEWLDGKRLDATEGGPEGGPGGGPGSDAGGLYLPSPVLPGVTRAWVLEWARRSRIAAEKRMLTIDDVLRASELVLTNSIWGVLPVTRLERHQIGGGVPGPIGQRLVDAWRERIGDEGGEGV